MGDSEKARVGPDLNDKDPFVVASTDGTEIKCEETTRWSGIRCFADVIGGKYQVRNIAVD